MDGMRTHPPTRRRLRQARAAGQVARSPLLTGAALWLGAAAMLTWGTGSLVARLAACLRLCLEGVRRGADPQLWLGASLKLVAGPVAAFMVGAFIWAALGILVQVGPLWTLTPLTGGERRVRRRTPSRMAALPRLGQIGLVGVVGGIAAGWSGAALWPPGSGWLASDAATALQVTGAAARRLLWSLGLLVLACGAIDWLVQRALLRRSLAMTPRELREEQRETELDPRYKRRHLHGVHPAVHLPGPRSAAGRSQG